MYDALVNAQHQHRAVLELFDEEMIAIVADPNQHIDLSLRFEIGIANVDTSTISSRLIEYVLRPVATAVLYDGQQEQQSATRTLKTADLQAANGTITVMLPVPKGFDPTKVAHTSDDGTQLYEIFLPEGVCAFTYDKDAGTISFTITHCSHLVSSFEAQEQEQEQAGSLAATGDAAPVAAAAFAALLLLAGACAVAARRRTAR